MESQLQSPEVGYIDNKDFTNKNLTKTLQTKLFIYEHFSGGLVIFCFGTKTKTNTKSKTKSKIKTKTKSKTKTKTKLKTKFKTKTKH